jgi:hypothetical protein
MPRSRRNRNPLPGRPMGGAPNRTPSRAPLLYGCFLASGAAGLILEVARSGPLIPPRQLDLRVSTASPHSCGLGIGARAGRSFAARAKEPLLAYARLGLTSRASCDAARASARPGLPLRTPSSSLRRRVSPSSVPRPRPAPVPTTAMGATLPLLVSDPSRRDPRTRRDGGPALCDQHHGAVAVAAAGFLDSGA